MTAKKSRTISLTTGQAIRLERAQANLAHLHDRYAQPLKEVRDAEDRIETALNDILAESKSAPSESGWRFIVDGDAATLVEGPE